jgi:hypothetical protein
MPDGIATPDMLAALYQQARTAPLAEALRSFGALVVGRPVYLVCGGHAVHDVNAPCLVDPSCPDEPVAIAAVLDDRTLAPWGLCFSAVSQPAPIRPVPVTLEPALAALRLGLLMRCLDTAFLHLEGRQSFGQKLLHHQLMKARFSGINADVVRMLDELALLCGREEVTSLIGIQQLISWHFVQAAKLMGGHGLLIGRCHSLEFLSSLLLAIHGRQSFSGLAAGSVR